MNYFGYILITSKVFNYPMIQCIMF